MQKIMILKKYSFKLPKLASQILPFEDLCQLSLQILSVICASRHHCLAVYIYREREREGGFSTGPQGTLLGLIKSSNEQLSGRPDSAYYYCAVHGLKFFPKSREFKVLEVKPEDETMRPNLSGHKTFVPMQPNAAGFSKKRLNVTISLDKEGGGRGRRKKCDPRVAPKCLPTHSSWAWLLKLFSLLNSLTLLCKARLSSLKNKIKTPSHCCCCNCNSVY